MASSSASTTNFSYRLNPTTIHKRFFPLKPPNLVSFKRFSAPSIKFRNDNRFCVKSSASVQAPPISGELSPAILLTDDALKHLSKMRSEKNEDLYLRIGVKQGGCSGMSYTMEFEKRENARPDDSFIEYDGFTIEAEKANKAIIGIVPEELTEDNYEAWKSCLKHYLVGNGLWGVVSGTEREPNRDEKEAHEEWKRKNALALHAIQLSCGASTYAKFKEAHMDAHFAWQHLAEKIKHRHHLQPLIHEPSSSLLGESGVHEHLDYGHLHRAIEQNNLHATMDIIHQDPNAVRARVTSHKDTALHIAILVGHMKIAEELIKKMEPEDLGMANEYGATPLSLAAISGVTKLAKVMVRKNERLVSIENKQDDGHLPVIVAALYGQKPMVRYLYEVTPKEELTETMVLCCSTR